MPEVDRPLILNVNDHDQTRYLVSRILEPRGYRVVEAANGEEALRKLELKPTLLVLDVKLPDLSGFEVCRMVKSRPETNSTLVLLTSATFVTPDRRVEGLEYGADGYLFAPYEPAELAATVKSLLRLGAAERKVRDWAEALRENDRRKDEFLAMLAHELRNPLAAINSALPLLGAYREGAPERHEQTRKMVTRQVSHLAHMVDDLLDVSRITRGRIELAKRPTHLGEVVEHAVSVVRPQIDARKQRLDVKVATPAMYVDGDGTRLEQILVNLLDNASKYTEPQGGIWIEAGPRERDGKREAVIRVRDSGMGIAAELLPRVFDLFGQDDQSLARSRGGMGIGLTLAKRLTELHGGMITARSDGQGRGAEFEVVLPLAAAPFGEESTAAGSGSAASSGNGDAEPNGKKNRQVLLIEDNDDARQALLELIELMGHQVLAAEDGIRGVEVARSAKPEVILVDIGLPGLNGYEVARRIRENQVDGERRPYLVALTGYGGKAQKDLALEAGFDMHVVKPVDVGALSRLLETV
jgi:signal transduction histidine kinase